MQELTISHAAQLDRSGQVHLRAVHLLAALPLADVIVAQLQARLEVNIGPLSLAQAFHGILLVVLLAVMLRRVIRVAAPARPAAIAAGFFAASIVLSAVVRSIDASVCLEDIVSDLKILYWLTAWMACMVVCRRPEDFRVILRGLVIAGTYAAASVLAVYFLGMEELSPYEGIAASAGGLNTAKGLGGILAVTGLVWIWLTRRSFRLLGAAGFVLCNIALVLTYQRAGLVAGCVAALWLAGWQLFKPNGSAVRNWALRPIVLAIAPVLLIAFVLGTTDLQKRWEDLADLDKAGSSRGAFWQEAAAIHSRADLPGRVVGIGYAGLVDRMEAQWGARIHSHSDLLDALVVYGALGLICWLAVYLAILRMILPEGLGFPAAAMGVAIFLVMVLECVLTGQMFGPHVMSFYLFALCGVCLGSHDRQRHVSIATTGSPHEPEAWVSP
jgi:hypothetical protein